MLFQRVSEDSFIWAVEKDDHDDVLEDTCNETAKLGEETEPEPELDVSESYHDVRPVKRKHRRLEPMEPEEDALQLFFKAMYASVNKLNPALVLEARKKIFNLVTELEEIQLTETKPCIIVTEEPTES